MEQPIQESKLKKALPLRRTLISFAICGLLSFMIMWIRGLFEVKNKLDLYMVLSDGFFVSGILVMGFGLLIVVSQNGAFDAIRFSIQSILSRFSKEKRDKYVSYAEYKEKLAAKGKLNCLFLILPAALFLLLGALFTMLFMNAS